MLTRAEAARPGCCEQRWMEVRHLQVLPPGPGPPLAWTADAPVAARLGQA